MEELNYQNLAAFSLKEEKGKGSFRALIENVADAVFIAVGEEGFFDYVNESATKLTKYSKEELSEMSFRQLLHPRFSKIAESHYQSRNLKEIKGKFKRVIIRKDRQPILIEITPAMIVWEGEKAMAVIARDITPTYRMLKKLKQEKERLEASEKKHRQVLETMIDTYYQADLNGSLVMVSPSGAKLLGYSSAEEILGKNLARDFYYNQEDRDKFVKELKLNKGKLLNYEITLKKKDGTPVIGETNSRFMYDDEGNIIGTEGIFRDISEKRRNEEKTFSLYKHLGVINRRVGILLDLEKENHGKNKEQIFEVIVNSALHLANAKICFLYKYQDSQEVFELLSGGGKIKEITDKIKIIKKEDCSFFEELASSAKRVQGRCNDYNFPVFEQDKKLKYFLSLPLFKEDKFKGCLLIGFGDIDYINTQDLDFYDMFAVQAGNILKNFW